MMALQEKFYSLMLVGLCLMAQAGCSTSVKTAPLMLDADRYVPAVAKYPATIGVYFPADFFDKNFYHQTAGKKPLTLHSNPASATLRALSVALKARFNEVRYLDTLQEGSKDQSLAFVMVPNIVTLISRIDTQVIRAGIFYQFDFYSNGKYLYSWEVSGVGSTNGPAKGSLQGTPEELEARLRSVAAERFDEAARNAVWDAFSVFLTELANQKPLSGRLPDSRLNHERNSAASLPVDSFGTLALIGPVFDQNQNKSKQQIEDCIVEEIEDSDLALKVMRLQSLTNHLYPWFSRSTYPQGTLALEQVLRRPAVQKRLEAVGVRYFLQWDGETTRDQFSGPFLNTVYGSIGYESAEKRSQLKAKLLDVETGTVVNVFAVQKKGTDKIVGLLYLVLPIPADTEEDVCQELSLKIGDFLNHRRIKK
ncbi:MAG: hypothetical protein JRD88_03260 [Deltaproteobacteria bacterium]|jgi:hypothetical protein|nr:hypothetical protein [Deltaproteobacteria bacterium]